MTFLDPAARHRTLVAEAGDYARAALAAVRRPYPHSLLQMLTGPGQHAEPRRLHPAFYGALDWHSSVEMHWALARLARLGAPTVPLEEISGTFDEHLTDAAMAVETEYVSDPANATFERPYGRAWALVLHDELATWGDGAPEGGAAERWAAAVRPLAAVVADGLAAWLGRLDGPVRCGFHPNTAFAMARALGPARRWWPALAAVIEDTGLRFFAADRDYPAGWEPSGTDFLSPALAEAELMAALLDPDAFAAWLDGFLPDVASRRPAPLWTPATVSDDSDGHAAHLHGLNLARAWCWRVVAEALPADDGRRTVIGEAIDVHAVAALDRVTGTDYMVEHWLAAYAVGFLG